MIPSTCLSPPSIFALHRSLASSSRSSSRNLCGGTVLDVQPALPQTNLAFTSCAQRRDEFKYCVSRARAQRGGLRPAPKSLNASGSQYPAVLIFCCPHALLGMEHTACTAHWGG